LLSMVYNAQIPLRRLPVPETSPWHHRDMSRWFEKIPWQVGDKPVCVRRSNGIWKRARRHDKRTFARRCTPGRPI